MPRIGRSSLAWPLLRGASSAVRQLSYDCLTKLPRFNQNACFNGFFPAERQVLPEAF
jgi:hypothetical protein